jgi:SAM-dependent methyltransferase
MAAAVKAVPVQSALPSSELPAILREVADILVDPLNGDGVSIEGDRVFGAGRREIPTAHGIPNFFVSPDHSGDRLDDITETVRSFYEETPFPNYDGLDSRESLAAKARKGAFATLLDKQLPDGALVLEAGCGTGQLSNFLGMSWNRKVIAADLCLNSLRLAKSFADRYAIRNVGFVQMNLFRPPFRDNSFDVVISNGVLHHTGDCEGGFRSILAKLKPGGYILVGLYNKYGRLPTLWKRWLFRAIGPSLFFLDPRLRDWSTEPQRTKAWFMDQYRHPHETRHSMGEVLTWFARYGVDFLNGVPHLDGTQFGANELILAPHSPGTPLTRAISQLTMLVNGGKDGGLHIMIGRKRSGARSDRAA